MLDVRTPLHVRHSNGIPGRTGHARPTIVRGQVIQTCTKVGRSPKDSAVIATAGYDVAFAGFQHRHTAVLPASHPASSAVDGRGSQRCIGAREAGDGGHVRAGCGQGWNDLRDSRAVQKTVERIDAHGMLAAEACGSFHVDAGLGLAACSPWLRRNGINCEFNFA